MIFFSFFFFAIIFLHAYYAETFQELNQANSAICLSWIFDDYRTKNASFSDLNAVNIYNSRIVMASHHRC